MEGFIQTNDAYREDVHKDPKSREAKGRRPFVAAISLNNAIHSVNMRFSLVKVFQKKELTDWTKHHIKANSCLFCILPFNAAGEAEPKRSFAVC